MLLLTQSTDMGGGIAGNASFVRGCEHNWELCTLYTNPMFTDFFSLSVNVSFLLAARVERECPRGAVGGALACARLA